MALNAIEMTVDDWIKIPDHPRQRNTEAHAKMALRGHLKDFAKPHSFVDAVKFHGHLYKINGHTRAFLWGQKKLKRPLSLTVNIVEARTEQEFKELYDMYDSKKAVKTTKDTLYGACREIGLDLSSGLLKSHNFASQLRKAARDARTHHNAMTENLYGIVLEWQKEIKTLDDLGLSNRYPFMVGEALKMLRSHPDKAGEFFRLVDKDQGIKDARGRDGVQTAVEFFGKKREAKATAGWNNWNDIDAEIRKAFKQWIDHRMNKTPRRLRTTVEELTA